MSGAKMQYNIYNIRVLTKSHVYICIYICLYIISMTKEEEIKPKTLYQKRKKNKIGNDSIYNRLIKFYEIRYQIAGNKYK